MFFCINNVAVGALGGICWDWCEYRTKTWDSNFQLLPSHQKLDAHPVSGAVWRKGRISVRQSS